MKKILFLILISVNTLFSQQWEISRIFTSPGWQSFSKFLARTGFFEYKDSLFLMTSGGWWDYKTLYKSTFSNFSFLPANDRSCNWNITPIELNQIRRGDTIAIHYAIGYGGCVQFYINGTSVIGGYDPNAIPFQLAFQNDSVFFGSRTSIGTLLATPSLSPNSPSTKFTASGADGQWPIIKCLLSVNNTLYFATSGDPTYLEGGSRTEVYPRIRVRDRNGTIVATSDTISGINLIVNMDYLITGNDTLVFFIGVGYGLQNPRNGLYYYSRRTNTVTYVGMPYSLLPGEYLIGGVVTDKERQVVYYSQNASNTAINDTIKNAIYVYIPSANEWYKLRPLFYEDSWGGIVVIRARNLSIVRDKLYVTPYNDDRVARTNLLDFEVITDSSTLPKILFASAHNPDSVSTIKVDVRVKTGGLTTFLYLKYGTYPPTNQTSQVNIGRKDTIVSLTIQNVQNISTLFVKVFARNVLGFDSALVMNYFYRFDDLITGTVFGESEHTLRFRTSGGRIHAVAQLDSNPSISYWGAQVGLTEDSTEFGEFRITLPNVNDSARVFLVINYADVLPDGSDTLFSKKFKIEQKSITILSITPQQILRTKTSGEVQVVYIVRGVNASEISFLYKGSKYPAKYIYHNKPIDTVMTLLQVPVIFDTAFRIVIEESDSTLVPNLQMTVLGSRSGVGQLAFLQKQVWSGFFNRWDLTTYTFGFAVDPVSNITNGVFALRRYSGSFVTFYTKTETFSNVFLSPSIFIRSGPLGRFLFVREFLNVYGAPLNAQNRIDGAFVLFNPTNLVENLYMPFRTTNGISDTLSFKRFSYRITGRRVYATDQLTGRTYLFQDLTRYLGLLSNNFGMFIFRNTYIAFTNRVGSSAFVLVAHPFINRIPLQVVSQQVVTIFTIETRFLGIIR